MFYIHPYSLFEFFHSDLTLADLPSMKPGSVVAMGEDCVAEMKEVEVCI